MAGHADRIMSWTYMETHSRDIKGRGGSAAVRTGHGKRGDSMTRRRFLGRAAAGVGAAALAASGVARAPFNQVAVDLPIAIYEEFYYGNYNVLRLLGSDNAIWASRTGAWTNFSQNPCTPPSAIELVRLLEYGATPIVLLLGEGIGATRGAQQLPFDALRYIWGQEADSDNDGVPDMPWQATLPVIQSTQSLCPTLIGAVTVDILWITGAGMPDWDDVPTMMADWPAPAEVAAVPDFYSNGQGRWDSFVAHFDLKNTDGQPAPYDKKTIYFFNPVLPPPGV